MTLTVRSLQEHPDRTRIHKLLYFAYSQQWVSDLKTLGELTIVRLLELLMDETESLEQLYFRLCNNAEKLNKPEKYIQLSHTIFETLKQHNQTDPSPQPNRFQLRFALMQVMTPYRAKSALMALCQIKSVPQSSSRLDSCSLDELLSKVLQEYPHFSDLQAGLRSLPQLPGGVLASEQEQIAQTLLEALRPHLVQTTSPVPSPHPVALPHESELDSDSLCTILVSPQQLHSTSQKTA